MNITLFCQVATTWQAVPAVGGSDWVRNGTAGILGGLPFPVMAKTGTAEDPSTANHDTDSWLIAAAPADEPAVVLASLVRGGGHGGETSGPVVKRALQYFADHRAEIVGGVR